jgi:hypothetical protein
VAYQADEHFSDVPIDPTGFCAAGYGTPADGKPPYLHIPVFYGIVWQSKVSGGADQALEPAKPTL